MSQDFGENLQISSTGIHKPAALDLSGLSKKSLVEEIGVNKQNYLKLFSLTSEEKARASDCPIGVRGFHDCEYISGDELQAILTKIIPTHLLKDFQHAKAIRYINKSLTPKVGPERNIIDEELSPDTAEGIFQRTLAIKVHAEPFINLYSPIGLSPDKDVLKILLVQAVVHDLAHGVWDHFFETAQYGEDAQSEQALEWINNLQEVAFGTESISKKSATYEGELEKDYGLEEFAEMVRTYVFNKYQFRSRNFGTEFEPNHDKFNYTEALFTRDDYQGMPVLPK